MSDSGIKHTCYDCGRKYRTVKTLKTHMKNFHKNNATGSDDGDYNSAQSDGQVHSDESSKISQPSSKDYDSDESTFTKWSKKLKRKEENDSSPSKKLRNNPKLSFSQVYQKELLKTNKEVLQNISSIERQMRGEHRHRNLFECYVLKHDYFDNLYRKFEQRNLEMKTFLKPDEITFIDAIRKNNSITDVAKLLNENIEMVDTIFDNVDRATINHPSEDDETHDPEVPT